MSAKTVFEHGCSKSSRLLLIRAYSLSDEPLHSLVAKEAAEIGDEFGPYECANERENGTSRIKINEIKTKSSERM